MPKKSSSGAAARAGCPSSDPFDGIDLAQVAECLRALAHPDRLRLVAILLREELAVGELAERLGLAQPSVSGHLRILQSRGMLTCRRDGHRMYYTVATPALNDICTCIRSHFGSCRIGKPS
ncbi:MAG: helix-turn-helix transcriptional regulator [Planctomycetes bacterium]|nr:helix-turn-helix transcriptional regulator [Planctomycetota bacterium]